MECVKVAMFAIVASLLALFLNQTKGEWAKWVGILAGIMLAVFVLSKMLQIKSVAQDMQNIFGNDFSVYCRLIWKALGMTYLCEIAADICKETGNQFLARQVEIFGRLAVLMMGLPILTSLYQLLIKMGG